MMGIKSKLNGYCAESLGGLEDGVSPLEMASAYATIANGGYRNRPRMIKKVVDREGKTVKLPKRWRVHRTKAFSNAVTYEATKILKQNIQSGTGTHANIGCPAGRQDRHHRQEHRCLVRRLHAAAVDRGLGRLPGLDRDLDERHVRADRRQHRRRHLPGRHLGRVHEEGRRQVLRRLQEAHGAVHEPAVPRPLRARGRQGRREGRADGDERRPDRAGRRSRDPDHARRRLPGRQARRSPPPTTTRASIRARTRHLRSKRRPPTTAAGRRRPPTAELA